VFCTRFSGLQSAPDELISPSKPRIVENLSALDGSCVSIVCDERSAYFQLLYDARAYQPVALNCGAGAGLRATGSRSAKRLATSSMRWPLALLPPLTPVKVQLTCSLETLLQLENFARPLFSSRVHENMQIFGEPAINRSADFSLPLQGKPCAPSSRVHRMFTRT
jgi:hypothetical protein